MKTACIVLRNKKDAVGALAFSPVVDVLTTNGYFSDEIVLIPYEDVALLHEKICAYASFDALFLITDKVILEGLERNLTDSFSLRFEKGIAAYGKTHICIVSADEEGKRRAQEEIVPYLNGVFSNRYDKMVLRFVGAPQETVKDAIDRAYAVSGDALSYHFSDRYADQRLEVFYDAVTPKMLADEVMRILLGALDDYVYALDDTPLEKRVYEGLVLRKKKLSVCESFTGGRISARMVSVPGVSAVYFEGITAYANEAKEERLSVHRETLRQFGAVSSRTAHEMAEGLLSSGHCNICVATTGIAGPKSDDTKKPVGLCYIAAGTDEKIFVDEYVFKGDRETVTETAVNFALFSLFKVLKN